MASSQGKMQAIILAAGLGKRMRSSMSKVMHPVLGKPMIWRILKTLNRLDLERIHIVLGHNAEQVESYIQKCIDHSELTVPISMHKQEPQLGTGHAVMAAQKGLNDFPGNILVVPGDCPLLSEETVHLLVDTHYKQHADLTLLTSILDNAKGYGRIIRSAQGQVLGIVEEKILQTKKKK